MDTVDYVRECYRQLSGTSTYQPQTEDLAHLHNQQVDVVLNKMALDVTSLYTNIPNREGIQAVLERVMKDRARRLDPRWIRDLLEVVLFKNNFELEVAVTENGEV